MPQQAYQISLLQIHLPQQITFTISRSPTSIPLLIHQTSLFVSQQKRNQIHDIVPIPVSSPASVPMARPVSDYKPPTPNLSSTTSSTLISVYKNNHIIFHTTCANQTITQNASLPLHQMQTSLLYYHKTKIKPISLLIITKIYRLLTLPSWWDTHRLPSP